jgi:hypothetical protein
MVKFNVDDVLLRMRESDSQVTQVLCELSSRSLNSDLAGLDVDLDCSGAKQLVSRSNLQTPMSSTASVSSTTNLAQSSRMNALTYLPPGWSMTLESRCNACCRRWDVLCLRVQWQV